MCGCVVYMHSVVCADLMCECAYLCRFKYVCGIDVYTFVSALCVCECINVVRFDLMCGCVYL